MTRRRCKPFDPAKAARENMEREQAVNQKARLDAQPDVVQKADARGVVFARRQDIFDQLHHAKSIDADCYNAVKRFERDLADSMGVGDAPVSGTGCDPRGPLAIPGHLLRRIDASDRMSAVGERIDALHYRLLIALLEPPLAGRNDPWRSIVYLWTGERDERGQKAIIKLTCKVLMGTYQAIDYRREAA